MTFYMNTALSWQISVTSVMRMIFIFLFANSDVLNKELLN